MIYDIVIVAHEKDFHKLEYCIKYACENLEFDEIHLILSERLDYLDKDKLEKFNKPIFYHKETDVLKINKDKIKFRPNWIYQMYLKMFQNVTKNDNFLVIESDAIINSKLSFFDNNKTIFHLGIDQNNEQYYNFNRKMLNIGREYNFSFISELMMYNKNIVNDMIIKSDCLGLEEFLEKSYNIIDINCYPADYELYGNFCYKYHFDNFCVNKILTSQNRKYGGQPFNLNEINYLINKNNKCDIITHHSCE
ncbi:hypothetical protein M0Q50_04585 [bacterium]|jgi:hypothetical protein|nr:hypothetical protein [bacterium]